jgi:hypothetical protein
MRRQMVEALVAAKREMHPELRRPLTWARLHAVCRRERITLALADLPPEHPAQVVPYFDRWSILISDDISMKERVRLAAHELAHVWAHHDAQHERWELVYQDLHPSPDDPAEREANAVAWLLIEGASDLPAEPRPSRRTPAIVVPRPINPYAVPAATGLARQQPLYGGRVMETRLQRALRLARPLPRPMKAGPATTIARCGTSGVGSCATSMPRGSAGRCTTSGTTPNGRPFPLGTWPPSAASLCGRRASDAAIRSLGGRVATSRRATSIDSSATRSACR